MFGKKTVGFKTGKDKMKNNYAEELYSSCEELRTGINKIYGNLNRDTTFLIQQELSDTLEKTLRIIDCLEEDQTEVTRISANCLLGKEVAYILNEKNYLTIDENNGIVKIETIIEKDSSLQDLIKANLPLNCRNFDCIWCAIEKYILKN